MDPSPASAAVTPGQAVSAVAPPRVILKLSPDWHHVLVRLRASQYVSEREAPLVEN